VTSSLLVSRAPALQLGRQRFSLESLHFFPEAVHEHQVEHPSHANDDTGLLGHVRIGRQPLKGPWPIHLLFLKLATL
jgi:hypothetical protein